MDVPLKRYRLPPREDSTSKRAILSDYPKTFKNTEVLQVSMKQPWREYPITAEPGQSWVQRGGTGASDKARVIYNPKDASQFDVAYHNPKKHVNHGRNFDLAPYRPAGYYSQK